MKTPWLGEHGLQQVQLDLAAGGCCGGEGAGLLGRAVGLRRSGRVAALRAVLGLESFSVAMRRVLE